MAFYLYRKFRESRQKDGHEPVLDEQLAAPMAEEPSNQSDALEKAQGPSGIDENARKDGQVAMRRYRWRIILGLFFPAVVQGVNTTMIASAMPFIASDFGKWCIRGITPHSKDVLC